MYRWTNRALGLPGEEGQRRRSGALARWGPSLSGPELWQKLQWPPLRQRRRQFWSQPPGLATKSKPYSRFRIYYYFSNRLTFGWLSLFWGWVGWRMQLLLYAFLLRFISFWLTFDVFVWCSRADVQVSRSRPISTTFQIYYFFNRLTVFLSLISLPHYICIYIYIKKNIYKTRMLDRSRVNLSN